MEPGSPFYKEIEDPNPSPEMSADENSSSSGSNTDENSSSNSNGSEKLPLPQPPSSSATKKKKMIGVSSIDDVVQVGACITASDMHGTPIIETQQYTPLEHPFMNMFLSQMWNADNYEFSKEDIPQVLHHSKLEDQITFAVPTKEQEDKSSKDTVLCGLANHPHGSVKLPKLVRRMQTENSHQRRWSLGFYLSNLLNTMGGSPISGSCGSEEIPIKRLVTNSDTFCRVVHKDSDVYMRSHAHSELIEGAREAEQKHVH